MSQNGFSQFLGLQVLRLFLAVIYIIKRRLLGHFNQICMEDQDSRIDELKIHQKNYPPLKKIFFKLLEDYIFEEFHIVTKISENIKYIQ